MIELPDCNAIAPHDISRDEWVKLRGGYVGGSDAATVAGVNPYKSVFELWAEKTGRVEPENLDDKAAVKWGTKLEPLLIEHFAQETGYELTTPEGMYVSKDFPFMAASLDHLVNTGTTLAILECKTAGFMQAEKWANGAVPEHYVFQVQHYLAVTGLDLAFVAVLIGGQDFRIIEIKRDDELIDDLIKREYEFWQCVQEDREPQVDGRYETSKLLDTLYPAEAESSIEVAPDFLDLLAELEAAKAEKKQADERARRAENEIKMTMREHEKATLNGKTLCTWVSRERAGYEVAPSVVRTLRPTPLSKLDN